MLVIWGIEKNYMHVYIGRSAESIYVDVCPLLLEGEFVSIKNEIQNGGEYDYQFDRLMYGDVYNCIYNKAGRK